MGKILIGVCVLYAMKKIFDESDEFEIIKYKREKGENLLTFKDDYAGDPPREIKALMAKISNPNSYSGFGVTQQKGILISGKPGVGKTWLTRVLADELKASHIYVNGASLKGGIFRGSGNERVKKLFKEARKTKEDTIIVIDEIDAIIGTFGDIEGRKCLLTEMDGFDKKKNDKITVIGLTNQPITLPNDLSRRFQAIKIYLPNKEGRKELLEFYVKGYMKFEQSRKYCILDPNIEYDRLAQEEYTKGFSHDMLKSVVTNVFTHVAELKNNFEWRDKDTLGLTLSDEGNVKIGHEAFEAAAKDLQHQIELGKEDLLRESNYPIPDEAENLLQKTFCSMMADARAQ